MPRDQEWHQLTGGQVSVLLGTDPDRGLTAQTAAKLQTLHGPNTLKPTKGQSSLRRALAQFNQPLVMILLVAGAVTAVLKEWVDSGVIFGVVLVNAFIGYLQETKAVNAIEALSRAMSTEATAVRDGQRVRLPASALVPGDLVVLQAGYKVPADLRLTESHGVRVDESTLTGESLPVEKDAAPLAGDTLLSDRTNMSYASTLVTAGQGFGVVVAIGEGTEVGRISHLISQAENLQTPLTRRITKLSRILLLVILAMAAVTAVVGVLRGEGVVEMFLAAVALAVGAIPEGLPAALTITLAIGVSRMARRRAIIRKLPAVETLGSTTVICSDKTGTLTENQMTVQRLATPDATYGLTGHGYMPIGDLLVADRAEPKVVIELPDSLVELLRAGVLCNDSSLYLEEGQWHIHGDPTEAALLVSAAKARMDHEETIHEYPRLDAVPFESQHQYMATLHGTRSHETTHGLDDHDDRLPVAYVKGAVEKILPRCSRQMQADGSLAPLDEQRLEATATRMASEGLRVLAFATKMFGRDVTELSHGDIESDLVFLGLQGMIDPPREEAVRAVDACHQAGVEVKMITGDHALTAVAIARHLGLRRPGCDMPAQPPVVTGAQLAALSDAELAQVVADVYVFARVTPEQKLRLVNTLQGNGHIVAMTGDGVNDAPALRQADIGVAMGITGTEVAKEAADMVLTDDNFASIEAAVEEGRGVFDNITKFITWTLPTNLGEGLVILAAVFAGLALPILPVQILWINMTTAILLGLMLSFEPKEAGTMSRPPRSAKTPILSKALVSRICMVGALLLAGSFGLFEYAERAGASLEEARTLAVNVFVFGEMFYLFNCRSLTQPSWKSSPRSNPLLFGGVGLMLVLQLLYTYVPGMNSLFGSYPIGLQSWALVAAASVFIHAVVELEKTVVRRRAGKKSPPPVC